MADRSENMTTRVRISGEKEYKEACKNINRNLALLNSEMKLVTAEYKDNANSMEALKAKQDILQRTYDEQAKKVEAAKKVLQEYENAEHQNIDAIQKAQRELNYQRAALENTNNALKENARQQQETEKATSAAAIAQKQYEEVCKGIDKNLSLLEAKLQEVNAKYKNNENSAKAVAEKQELLKKAYDEQAKKIAETERAYESMVRQYGETSSEAQELETQLYNERAALYDVENQLAETEQGHNGLASAMGNLGNIMAKSITIISASAAAIGTAVAAGLGYVVSQADEAKGALNDFCAATGTTTDEIAQYKQVMENIYNANFGEGFEDIAAAMTEVRQQVGNLGSEELEKMTTKALMLRDTFDFDVAESTRAVTQLMQKFGISSEEAYNLIAQGAQNGLNKNGDLLDVINEYSNQYSQAGLSAENMFNSIANGAATGVWSIDKMGDAFKEFSIRMNDGTANDYLISLGLSADEIVEKFQKGGDNAKEAMFQISEALNNCDDKTLQYTAGVGLMGTMWEDMGAEACMSLMDVDGQINKTIDAMGEINTIKYDTFSDAMQGAGRILQTSFIMPIGDQALPIFSEFANELAQGAANADGNMEKLAQGFGNALGNMVNRLSEVLPQITSFAVELVKGLVDGIVESAPVIIQAGIDMIKGFVDGIVEAIPTLTESATEIISTLINGITEMIPTLAAGAIQIITGLAKGLSEALPELIPSVVETMLIIVDTLINNIPMLINAALQLVTGLIQGIIEAIPLLIEAMPEIITAIINGIVEGLPLIITSAGDIMIAIIDGIIMTIPLLIEAMPEIIIAIVNGLITGIPQVLAAVGEMVMGILGKLGELVQQIPLVIAEAIVHLVEWGINMRNKAKEIMNTMSKDVIKILKELPQKIYNSISSAISKVATWGISVKNKAVEGMINCVNGIKGAFANIGNDFIGIGSNIIDGIWNGISSGWSWLKDKVSDLAKSLLDTAKSALGIASPSKKFRDEVGVFMAQGIGVGFVEEMKKVNKTIESNIPQEFDIGANMHLYTTSAIDGNYDNTKSSDQSLSGIVVNQYIYANETDYAKQQKEAARNFRMIARAV